MTYNAYFAIRWIVMKFYFVSKNQNPAYFVVSYIIILLFCVRVCVCLPVCMCVCPTWDLRNRMSYRHAPYAVLKSFAWQGAQTAFPDYTTCGSTKHSLQVFRQLCSKTRARTVTLTVTLGRTKPAHNFNFVTILFSTKAVWAGYSGQDESFPLPELCWNILHGYTLKNTPSTS